jgi:hypothetical protein
MSFNPIVDVCQWLTVGIFNVFCCVLAFFTDINDFAFANFYFRCKLFSAVMRFAVSVSLPATFQVSKPSCQMSQHIVKPYTAQTRYGFLFLAHCRLLTKSVASHQPSYAPTQGAKSPPNPMLIDCGIKPFAKSLSLRVSKIKAPVLSAIASNAACRKRFHPVFQHFLKRYRNLFCSLLRSCRSKKAGGGSKPSITALDKCFFTRLVQGVVHLFFDCPNCPPFLSSYFFRKPNLHRVQDIRLHRRPRAKFCCTNFRKAIPPILPVSYSLPFAPNRVCPHRPRTSVSPLNKAVSFPFSSINKKQELSMVCPGRVQHL